jgi:predicted RNA-binding protein with PIN domain
MNILFVDGYNMIGAWDFLNSIKQENLELARVRLIEMLAEYQSFTNIKIIVVFDAFYVKSIEKKYSDYKLEIVFTRENETADQYIEKTVKSLISRRNKVWVATNDSQEQWQIFAQGALRKSANELLREINDVKIIIKEKVKNTVEERPINKIQIPPDLKDIMEKMRRGNKT